MRENGRMGRCMVMVSTRMRMETHMKESGEKEKRMEEVIFSRALGVEKLESGDVYDGEWRNDEKNGQGNSCKYS